MKEAMQRELDMNANVLFLIDGFPRNQDNLDGWTRYMDCVRVMGVVLLDVDVEVTKQRIIERARDSNDSADSDIIGRIHRRKERAKPVIAHYKKLGMLHQIDANR